MSNHISSLKSGWKMVRFGDVVRNANLVERNPLKRGIERIVGLEHIEPENLHVKNWNSPEDGTSFTRKFVSGQVLFGKRRAYQRKVALAEFEGICSGDILTFETKDSKVLLPELLPFIVQSDGFFDYALGTSAGSLSPRTSWKALKDYEFPLPPKDEQRKIAEILWAADEAVECYRKTHNDLVSFENNSLNNLLDNGISSENLRTVVAKSLFQTKNVERKIPKEWKIKNLSEVVEEAISGFASGKRSDKGIFQLRMNNVSRDCKPDWKEVIRIPAKIKEITTYVLNPGDILFNNTNSDDLVGKSFLFEGYKEQIVFSNHFTRIRTKQNVLLPKYLALWLKRNFQIGLFERRCQKWIGQAAVQKNNLLSLEILVPPIEEQNKITRIFSTIDNQSNEIILQIKHLENIKKILMYELRLR